MWSSGAVSSWHTNVWTPNGLDGTYSQTGAQPIILNFYLTDWLGTRRVTTDYEGNAQASCLSLPYGNGETCTATPTEHLFTGKVRDAESGNDYFGARYYASDMGRFLIPDWSAKEEPVPYAKLDDPQTLNLYAYLMNNPLGGVDADGHDSAGQEMDRVSEQVNQMGNDQDQMETLGDMAWAANPEPPPPAAQQQSQPPVDQSLTNVVYNESGSLRANSKVKPGAPGSAEDLANGRQAIAEIANRVIDAGHPNRVAPSDLRDNAAMKTGAYALSRTAADAALDGSNISNGATQYRTRVGDDVTTPVGRSSTNPGTPVSEHYGPFVEGNHTVVIVVAQ